MTTVGIGEGSLLASKYRLIRQVGIGAMGSVWVAENLAIEAPVAVKLLHASLADDAQAVKRFELEAKSAARLRHRNIVSVFDLGALEDGPPFIVMELMEGESLERIMQRRGRLPPEELLGVVLPVLGALAVAHGNQIVHRDLKPENIFLSVDPDGTTTPKIVDFGVSKMTTIDRQTRMTRTGMVVGTPIYMPPEQARGKEVDGRADLWAMGVIMYEALTAQLPFDGENYNTLVASILTQEARPISAAAPDLDPELGALVMRALRRDVDERYASADVFAAELGAWLVRRGLPVPPRCPEVSVVIGSGQAAVAADRARREVGSPRSNAAPPRPARAARRSPVPRVLAGAGVLLAALGAGAVAFVVARGGPDATAAPLGRAAPAAAPAPVSPSSLPTPATPPPVAAAALAHDLAAPAPPSPAAAIVPSAPAVVPPPPAIPSPPPVAPPAAAPPAAAGPPVTAAPPAAEPAPVSPPAPVAAAPPATEPAPVSPPAPVAAAAPAPPVAAPREGRARRGRDPRAAGRPVPPPFVAPRTTRLPPSPGF